MNDPEKIENKQIIGTLENICLLRKLFIKRSTRQTPLHFGQVTIMHTIEQNENCTQATLAEQLNVTPASVATSTKRLQKAGLITKTIDKDNLRCKRLALTDRGRSVIAQHIELFQEYDELVFRDFTEKEKAELLGYLNRIISRMQAIEGIDEQFDSPLDLTILLRRSMGNLIPESDNENDNKEF